MAGTVGNLHVFLVVSQEHVVVKGAKLHGRSAKNLLLWLVLPWLGVGGVHVLPKNPLIDILLDNPGRHTTGLGAS